MEMRERKGGAYVVTTYRVSVAGDPNVGPYQELSRRYYRWKWLAKLLRGPKFGAGRIRPGEWAFWRAEVIDAASVASVTGEL
jgi:hypothetical protein